jgi:hypothetical protein
LDAPDNQVWARDSKKKEISMSLKFSGKTGKPYFEVFVQTLNQSISPIYHSSNISINPGILNASPFCKEGLRGIFVTLLNNSGVHNRINALSK